METNDFKSFVDKNYPYLKEAIILGKPIWKEKIFPEVSISIPISMVSRHGLICGASGGGKTKTIQLLAEGLSNYGVPTFLMDIKGDLSGIARPAERENPKILDRQKKLELPWIPKGFPVEFLSISEEKGTPLHFTLEEFGSLLLARILDLNDTQESVLAVLFTYCKDHKIRLLYLEDLYKALQYLIDNKEAKDFFIKKYGTISSSSLGIILRKVLNLKQEGGSKLFGKSFELNDFLISKEGLGVLSILRLVDIQKYPRIFSTFILGFLNRIYENFEEIGDSDKPKFVLFIDEAHLIFKNTSKAILEKIESILKLIRSKGIGIYFCSQVPSDIPSGILAQLGLKIQHALRGTTAKDQKEIKKALENYPNSPFYKLDTLTSQMGIGEALISSLNEKGISTPLVHTYMRAPYSRMNILSENEIKEIVANSLLNKKYDQINLEEEHFNLPKLENKEKKETLSKKEDNNLEKFLKNSVVKNFFRIISTEATKLFFAWLKKTKKNNTN